MGWMIRGIQIVDSGRSRGSQRQRSLSALTFRFGISVSAEKPLSKGDVTKFSCFGWVR